MDPYGQGAALWCFFRISQHLHYKTLVLFCSTLLAVLLWGVLVKTKQ